MKLSLFIIRAFVNTRENRAANAAILKRLAVPGEPINEAGGRFRGLNISARHVPSSEMSQRKLFEPDTEPVFDSAYRPDARIVLVQGDSLETLRALPASVAKLIITSPPYNIGKEYETQTKLEHYLAWLNPIIHEIVRVLSPRGSLCWQVGNYVEDSEVFPLDLWFYPVFKKLGLKLRNRVIWHFEHGLHCSVRFSGRYETLLWFTKTDDYTFNLDKVRIPSKYPGKTHYSGPKRGQPSGNPFGKNPSDVWTGRPEELPKRDENAFGSN